LGRLFWKFFFFILLAQVSAIVGISGTLWLKHKTEDSLARSSDRLTNAALVAESAEMALQQGGPGALGRLEVTLRHFQIYVIDERNRDIFGRLVSLGSIQKFRAGQAAGGNSPLLRNVLGPDKQSYLVFYSAMEDAWGRDLAEQGGQQESGMPAPPGFPDRPTAAAGARRDAMPGERWHALRPPLERGFHPLLPLVSAFVASLLFAALLAWYMSKPIRSLRTAFVALAGGNLDARVGATMGRRRDELADLGHEFDAMAEKLIGLMQSQRRLMHDVSHELRSPLARLQAAIGLARQQPEKMEATLDRVENECVRMDKLVGELLTLSRIESGVTATSDEVLMGELMAELIENARFEAEAKQRRLDYSGQAEVIVHGQFELLYRALENVVRNAIKHTADGSSVTVQTEVELGGGRLKILVCDQGSGVPEAELPAIFEPFYRGSQAGAQQGYGLGLTIARRVVQAHGGTISAANRHTGSGLCVEICLPCTKA